MQVGTPCITKVEDKSDYSGSTSVETRSLSHRLWRGWVVHQGVMTFKQIIEKYKQKQALIDTMRGDEKIGLYDDNPKNHGYER